MVLHLIPLTVGGVKVVLGAKTLLEGAEIIDKARDFQPSSKSDKED